MTELLLTRLCAASLSLCFMTVLALLMTRIFRIKSFRLRALLWLLVLAKPLVVLIFGAPVAIPIYFPRTTPIGDAAQASPSVMEPAPSPAIYPATHPSLGNIQPPQKSSSKEGSIQKKTPIPVVSFPQTASFLAVLEKNSLEKGIVFAWLGGVGILMILSLRG